MFQTIDGQDVYVVDLAEKPELPINDGGNRDLAPYAEALTRAITKGEITEFPGKYAINVTPSGGYYNVFKVVE